MSIINKLSIETIIENALLVFKVMEDENPDDTELQLRTIPNAIKLGIRHQILKQEQIPSFIARRLIQSRTHNWFKNGVLNYPVVRETAVELLAKLSSLTEFPDMEFINVIRVELETLSVIGITSFDQKEEDKKGIDYWHSALSVPRTQNPFNYSSHLINSSNKEMDSRPFFYVTHSDSVEGARQSGCLFQMHELTKHARSKYQTKPTEEAIYSQDLTRAIMELPSSIDIPTTHSTLVILYFLITCFESELLEEPVSDRTLGNIILENQEAFNYLIETSGLIKPFIIRIIDELNEVSCGKREILYHSQLTIQLYHYLMKS